MKTFLVALIAAFLLASCSGIKYSYRFNSNPLVYPNQKSDRISKTSAAETVDSVSLVASSDAQTALILTAEHFPENSSPITQASSTHEKAPVFEKIKMIKKAARQANQKLRDSAASVSSLDHDLKLAILFGVVGIVALILLILGKIFGVIGGISLIIATAFFVRWFLEQ